MNETESESNGQVGAAPLEARHDWAEEAERDLSEVVGPRFFPWWLSAPLCAALGATAYLTDPPGLNPVAAAGAGGFLFVWGIVLRSRERSSVRVFWSAAIVSIIVFCAGLVFALDREDPLAAVFWSIAPAIMGWMLVMSSPSRPERP